MIVKSRAQFRALVTRRARVSNYLNSHPVADLNIDCDNAYREMRLWATEYDSSAFLTKTGQLAVPSTPPVAGENYVVVPCPVDALVIKRVELTSGPDYAWTLIDQGIVATEDTNTGVLVVGSIAISPIPAGGMYQIWYLREFADTSADSGPGGFYVYSSMAQQDYHLYACVATILISDNDAQGALGGILALKREAQEAMRVTEVVNAGPSTWVRDEQYWPM